MSFLVGCAGGMTIQMDTSAVIPTWADRAWDLRLRILGTAGTLEVESTSLAAGESVPVRDGCWTPSIPKATVSPMSTWNTATATSPPKYGDFAGAIRGEHPPDVSPEDALTL